MNNTFYQIGQIIGIIAAVESLIIFVSTKRSKILILKLISDFLWTLNNLFCMKFTAMFLDFFAMGRETVFYFRGKRKWADHVWWVFIFLAVTIISPILEWVRHGSFYIVPLFAAMGTGFAVIGLYQKRTLYTKLFIIASQICYLLYNSLDILNYAGIIGSSLTLISALIGIVRELILIRKNKLAVNTIANK